SNFAISFAVANDVLRNDVLRNDVLRNDVALRQMMFHYVKIIVDFAKVKSSLITTHCGFTHCSPFVHCMA
ncbi:MAG: hypothetical protein IJ323_01465, partial [Clostridia bacterium]|nr:hypothetical protein [Clostridia bacterium]